MAQIKAQRSELLGALKELADILPALFEKMKQSKVALQFMNLPHDKQYEGKPLLYHLPPVDSSSVQMKKEKLMIEHKDVIYQIHSPKNKNVLVTLKLFLKWATENLKHLVDGVIPEGKILQVPRSITFFSLSTLPPRKPIPAFSR